LNEENLYDTFNKSKIESHRFESKQVKNGEINSSVTIRGTK